MSSAATTPPPSPTPAASSLSPATLAAEVCAIVLPAPSADGLHCGLENVHVSSTDPAWVNGGIGYYNAQNQPASDTDAFIVNLTTHAVAGPTNIGFCQDGGPGKGLPVTGYTAVPAAVLAGFGLSPCPGLAGAPSGNVPTTVAAFAGSWGAHEVTLTIANGTGSLRYADLTKCPSCSFGSAPAGTLSFVLTTAQGAAGVGSVTATSDAANYAEGAAVTVKLAAGTPGQLLMVTIGGKQLLPFCNATSAGQCGA
ncbi:MAG TPA: hypothetical protein VHZ96_13635 [Frankiaceae bacterium]|nr:hypothetical protein [Frankiaceae bacterium]